MHLITVCNKRCAGLDLWEKTARLNSLVPIILGLDDKRQLGHESQKFGLKFILLANYLQTLPPQDLCLITDGFDVIFHKADTLGDRLMKSLPSHQLLFAADVYENPDQGFPYKTAFLKAPYLNSGVYAGTASTILAVLRQALEKSESETLSLDDQRYFTEYMFQNPGVIIIDHACHFFACTAGLEYQKDFYVMDDKLIVLGGMPSVLHFQGFSKDTRIIEQLYNDSEIRRLGKMIMRMPPKWKKALGDSLVSLGALVPVEKQYRVYAGAILSMLILASLFILFLS